MIKRILNLVSESRAPDTIERGDFLHKLSRQMKVIAADGQHLAVLIVDVRSSDAYAQSLRSMMPVHVQVARQCLQTVLRPSDVVASIGWERFCVLLYPLKGEGHALLAANKVVSAITTSTTGGPALELDVAVGVAVHPEHGRDAEHLLRLAELACEGARSEEERIRVYNRQVGSAQADELVRLRDFKTALQNNSIEVWFQPQIRTRDGCCVGAEALMRWQRIPGEFVSPPDMVELAERNGLTALLTSRILKSTLRAWSEFKSEGLDLTLSVNLCARDVNDLELPELVRQTLATWGMPAERLNLEVTEGSLIGDVKTATQVLHALKLIGCRISIDDFGTGYSSMAYLTRLPLDELKIDQVFVRDMLSDRSSATIVRAITELTNNLGLQVVAEGVEDIRTAAALTKLGCELLQGYLASKPLPKLEFQRWVKDWNARLFLDQLSVTDADHEFAS